MWQCPAHVQIWPLERTPFLEMEKAVPLRKKALSLLPSWNCCAFTASSCSGGGVGNIPILQRILKFRRSKLTFSKSWGSDCSYVKPKEQPIHSITNLSFSLFWPGCQEAQHLMRKLNHGHMDSYHVCCATPFLPLSSLPVSRLQWAILSYKSSWSLFRKTGAGRVIFHSLPDLLSTLLWAEGHIMKTTGVGSLVSDWVWQTGHTSRKQWGHSLPLLGISSVGLFPRSTPSLLARGERELSSP